MTAYVLHARRFRGKTLGDPDSGYQFRAAESDDLEALRRRAGQLIGDGVEVVIHDHDHPSPLSGACDYRPVATYYPDGRVEGHDPPP